MKGGPATLLGGLALAVLAGLAAGMWTWTTPGDPALYPATGPDAVDIRVLDNGFHTDIAVPRRALEARGGPLGAAAAALAPGDWVRIGWGDARFYVEEGPIRARLADGARAFLKPGNPSVVMLDPADRLPAGQALRLSPAGFDALAARVEASLDLSGGAARTAAVRPGDDARFLASVETFSVLNLCNHWTARTLNAGGIEARPMPSILSGEVMRASRRAATLNEAALDRAARRD